ncbi:MAG: hypothetical protein II993_09595 [Anaerotignum sp.]|nr:hypothetical protein [Anaerotignum sp.]
MKRMMYMFDYARLRTLHHEEFTCLLALLARLGYKELGLYLEGAFLPDQHAGAVRNEIITPSDADWILTEAAKQNIIVLPMTNVLYHMEHWLCQERYAHLRRTGPHERYLINFEDPEAIPFALEIIRSLADMFHTNTVHIGLDEFPFTTEEIPAIGEYIAAVTGQMMAEGLTPAVWGDMFWMEQSLTSYLPRETEIHDWNYYGHRPESLRYFRKEGFRQVIAVPSDNGWEGFTGCQRTTGHLRARTDIPVVPGEIEAFLQDAESENADGCMIANWENTVGRSVWAALVPAARAGLWMQGKWEQTSSEETQVELALFGRITPYTRIVQCLRKLQMHMAAKCHIRLPQDALYRMDSMLSLLHKPADFWADTIALYTEMLPEMEQELAEWTPQSPVERYARAAMVCVITNVRAALTLMQFSQSRTVYRQAAIVQFSDSGSYCEHLAKVEEILNSAIQGMRASRQSREDSIADTGITRQDLLWQDRLISYLLSLQEKLQTFQQNSLSIVSLPCFTEFLYSWEFGKGGLVP